MATLDPGAERDMLLAYLNAQRRHVLGILEGLDDEALRRPVLPSGWSCLGLLRHLALDDERFWFQAVLGGVGDVIAETTHDAANPWEVGPETSAQSVFDLYHEQVERADAIIAATPLDAPPAWWPEFFGSWRLDNTREVMLHVITETAVHAGHLDAARELIDGKTWLVLN